MKIMRKKAKTIIPTIILFIMMIFLSFVFLYDNFPSMYKDWIRNSPATFNKTTKVVSKKKHFNTNFSQTETNTEKLKILTNDNTSNLNYHGVLISDSKDTDVNVAVYSDPRSIDNISDELLNTGNAGVYPHDNDLTKTNMVMAAHTYISEGYNNQAFTPLQYKTKVGDVFYYTDGKTVYTYKVYNKEVINSSGGRYILDKDRYKDKKVNPSGKGMLTLYDCTEPLDPSKFIENPPERNVFYLSLEKSEKYSNLSDKMKEKLGAIPTYNSKTNKIENTSRKNNFKLRLYDFLFGVIKIQNLMKYLA